MSESEIEPQQQNSARSYLRSLLNQHLQVELSDGRRLIGQLLCTDRDLNIILGGCTEHVWLSSPPSQPNPLSSHESDSHESCSVNAKSKLEHEVRVLGLVVVPGNHIVKLSLRKDIDESS